MTSISELLLTAPDEHLDPQMKPLIEKWDDPPTSLQILEVLDHCVYSSLASGFVVSTLQTLYSGALHKEGKMHDDNIQHTTWRNS